MKNFGNYFRVTHCRSQEIRVHELESLPIKNAPDFDTLKS